MLEFHDNNTTVIETFEDFILLVFVMVDDFYQQYVPASVKNRRNIELARLSDSECITIAICGELVGVDSENAWYSFVKRNFSSLFPKLCSRSRFNRTRRNLLQATELIREKLTQYMDFTASPYRIVDSFPLPVCKFGRARYTKSFRTDGASYGKCPSKKETYFGFKVHALITLEGFITRFEITPASLDDRPAVFDLTEDMEGIRILGDKGYSGKELREFLFTEGKKLYALKPSNCRENWPAEFRRLLFKERRRVETTFSQMCEQLHAESVLAKSFRGLCTRLVNKILGYNLCLAINYLFGKTMDIAKIKKLIF